MIKWFKIWWSTWDLKFYLIFLLKTENQIRLFRQKIILIVAIIHMTCFFHFLGSYETFLLYFFLWEMSGPQIDKYRDEKNDEEDEES